MTFGDTDDIRVADALLRAARDIAAVGAVARGDGRQDVAVEYSGTRRGRSGGDHEPVVTVYGHTEAALMGALTRVVDGNAEHATELRKHLAANPESPVGPPLWTFMSKWFPEQCWNGFCVNSFCPGVAHTDTTGRSWQQREGYVYNPANGKYDLPEAEHTGPVTTIYRRDAEASGIRP